MGQALCFDQPWLNPHEDSPYRKEVKLMKFEQIMAMIPATSFISFFDGEIPKEYLMNRSREILAQNPWLQGRLKKSSNGDIALVYSNDPLLPVHFISFTKDDKLSDSLSAETSSRVFRFLVKTGLECMDSDLPLFKITAIEISNTKFALVFSNAHCLGDIHTLYSIYEMFSASVVPYGMIVQRDYSFDDHLEVSFNESDIAWHKSPGLIMNLIGNALFGSKPDLHLQYLNQPWIEKQKKLMAERSLNSIGDTGEMVDFVSTNDIVSAWFYNFSKSDVGTMAVNLRNRNPRWTDKHAGNYISAYLTFQKGEFDPRFIRKSVKDLRPKHRKDLPGMNTGILGANICFMSSWVSLFKELQLEGCQQILHFPLKDPDENGPKVPAGNLCFFFRPTKQSLGVCALTRTFTQSELLKEEIIGSATDSLKPKAGTKVDIDVSGPPNEAEHGGGRDADHLLAKDTIFSTCDC